MKIIFLNVLIHNLKTAWPTKISMPFLSPLDPRMHALFFEKVLIIFRYHTKQTNFKLGCSTPLIGTFLCYWHVPTIPTIRFYNVPFNIRFTGFISPNMLQHVRKNTQNLTSKYNLKNQPLKINHWHPTWNHTVYLTKIEKKMWMASTVFVINTGF